MRLVLVDRGVRVGLYSGFPYGCKDTKRTSKDAKYHGIMQLYNALVGKDLKVHLVPNP